MNLLKIAMKDLKEFIVQKKIIFIILIISLIVSSYGFLFFTSLNMNIAQIMNSYKKNEYRYYISYLFKCTSRGESAIYKYK